MTHVTTLHPRPEAGPMLFADCPFCLGPMPVDVSAGIADCPACGIVVELAADPAPVVAPAPLPVPAPARVLSPAA